MIKQIKIVLLVAVASFVVSCGEYDELLRSRDYLAMYDAGLRYQAEGRSAKAIVLLGGVEPVLEGTEMADTLKFYLAQAYYDAYDFTTSAMQFDEFRKNYSRSPFAEEAEYMYAMSFYRLSPEFELDQAPSLRAQSAFFEYMSRYPDNRRSADAQEKIDELQMRQYDKGYDMAYTYYKIRAYNSAITAFKNAMKLHPNTPHREKMMYYSVLSNYYYARNSIESLKRERYYNTVDAALSFISAYEESAYIDEVEDILANARRFSKSGSIYSIDSSLGFSDEVMAAHGKKVARMQKRVDEGKMTQEEADAKIRKSLERLGVPVVEDEVEVEETL